MAKLTLRRRRNRSAERVRHQLHAVANAEHWRAHLEHGFITLRRARVGNALRAAREHDPDRISRADLFSRRIGRPDFRINRKLAKATGDELRVLRAEIENDDGLMAQLRGPGKSEVRGRRS